MAPGDLAADVWRPHLDHRGPGRQASNACTSRRTALASAPGNGQRSQKPIAPGSAMTIWSLATVSYSRTTPIVRPLLRFSRPGARIDPPPGALLLPCLPSGFRAPQDHGVSPERIAHLRRSSFRTNSTRRNRPAGSGSRGSRPRVSPHVLVTAWPAGYATSLRKSEPLSEKGKASQKRRADPEERREAEADGAKRREKKA